MSDLLTPEDLAEINDAAHNLRAAKFFHDADRVFALLRHIAALEARTPAPALPADMETLLADAGYKAVLAALRQEAVDKCAGGFGAPDLDADYQLSLSLLVREVYQILNIEQHIDALATALRETLARAEKAEAERDTALRQRDNNRQQLSAAYARQKDIEAERDAARKYAEELYAQSNSRHVTCVYCGHQYEDGTPESQDARLTAHIKECEKHPIRALEAEVFLLKACCDPKNVDALATLMQQLDTWNGENPWLGVCASVQLLIGERDALTADLAAARKELAGLGPVEWQYREHPTVRLWGDCSEKFAQKKMEIGIDARAIRRVLEGGAA